MDKQERSEANPLFPGREKQAWTASLTLTVISLSLIYLYSSQRAPNYIVPGVPQSYLDAIPHINAAVIAVAFLLLITGYRAIKNGNIERHRRFMISTTTLFFLFLALYLTKLANEGVTEFTGDPNTYRYIYLPFLSLHMVLATVCIPLVLYCAFIALLAGTDEVKDTMHPTIGRIAVPLWGISFLMGISVYLMLYHLT